MAWVYFPLHPDTPAGGLALADLFPGRDLEPIHRRLNALLDEEGLPHGPRTHTFNSRLAQELGKWADSRPDGAPVHQALYRAYFADARDIGDPEVLLEVAASAGLPLDEARDVLTQRTFRDAVDADWAQARASGVTGVPTFICRGHQLVGAQPYDVFEQLMQAAHVLRR